MDAVDDVSVLMVTVAVEGLTPSGVTDGALTLQVEFEGEPVQERAIALRNPPAGESVRVLVAVAPCAIADDEGDSELRSQP